MADLSSLIYIYPEALIKQEQPNDVAEPPSLRPRLQQAGTAGRLAPLLAILALSMFPLGMSIVSQKPSDHAPSVALEHTMPVRHALTAAAVPRARPRCCTHRITTVGWGS